MDETTYSVDTIKKFAPIQASSVAIRCFHRAHKDLLLKRTNFSKRKKRTNSELPINEINILLKRGKYE